MKISYMISTDIEVDVYDDYNEELGICFCGPCKLTEEGKKRFGWVLEQDIDVFTDEFCGCYAGTVHAENEEEVLRYREFFESAAGYCGEHTYELYFKE